MKFTRDEEIHLEKWIIRRLEEMHQHNAETLSKYVLSLVKQDKDNLKQFCHDELRTFLKDSTSEFVSSLFQSLEAGSFKFERLGSDDNIDRRNSIDGLERSNSLDERRDSDDEDSRRRGFRNNRRDSDGGDRSKRYGDDDREKDRNQSQNQNQNQNQKDRFRDRDHRERSRDRDNRDRGDNRGGDRDYDRRNNRNFDNRRNFNRDRDQKDRFDRRDNSEKKPDAAWQPAMPPGYPPMNAPPMPPYGWNPAMPGFMAPYPPFPQGGMMYPGFPYPQDPQMYHQPQQNNPFLPPSDPNSVNQPPTPNGSAPANGEEENAQNAEGSNNPAQPSDKPSEDLFPKSPAPPAVPMPYPPMFMGYENYMNPHMYQNNMPQNNTSDDNSRRGNRNNNNNNNNNRNNRNNNNNNNNNKIQLPENERCTLRCTGIPTYTTEEEIKHFFESFGHVVKLQVSPMEDHNKKSEPEPETGEDGEPKKKTYNECLIQYYSPQNAKKCLTSQIPILNNRYIRIYPSNFNIILPSDVEPPSYEIIEQDKALLSIKEIQPKPFESNLGKKKAGVHTIGVSNKWRKTNDAKVPGADAALEVNKDLATTSSDFTTNQTAIPSISTGNDTSPQKPENTELKQEFEQLKNLKQQAEDILKQKERILQAQVEKCREMMHKLEGSGESDSKAALLQNLENKIVDLQAQLRTVREQIEKGVVSEKNAPVAAPVKTAPFAAYRGYGTSGRVPYAGRNTYRGGFPGRGGGRNTFPGRYPNKFGAPNQTFNPTFNQGGANIFGNNTGIPTQNVFANNPFASHVSHEQAQTQLFEQQTQRVADDGEEEYVEEIGDMDE